MGSLVVRALSPKTDQFQGHLFLHFCTHMTRVFQYLSKRDIAYQKIAKFTTWDWRSLGGAIRLPRASHPGEVI
jgi:hypothetical protein